jgi:hypothetical protein
MLIIHNNKIEGNTFKIKEQLKSMNCKWDSDYKQWGVSNENIKAVSQYLEQVNHENKMKVFEAWKAACEFFNYKFVKKGTEEYNQVKLKFISLVRGD